MRNWVLLGLAVFVLGLLGCSSSVHPSVRDAATNNAPTNDTGFLATSTTGGDAAGSLNLDASHQGEVQPSGGGRRRGRGRRGGGGD